MAANTALKVMATDAQLEAKLAEPGLKVVELHSWAGPCSSMAPSCRKLADATDEKILQFLVVDASKCQLLPQALEYAQTCQPIFLLCKNGKVKAKIEGANTPALERAVQLYATLETDADLEDNPFAAAINARRPVK